MISSMSHKKSTQDIEKRIFNGFAAAYPEAFEQITYTDKPDVIAMQNGTKIGIELTALYIEDGEEHLAEQKLAQKRQSIMQKAQQQYQSDPHHIKNLEVSVTFKAKQPLNEDELAARIVQKIRQSNAAQKGYLPLSKTDDLDDIESVYLYVAKEDEAERSPPHWRCINVYSPPSLDLERLQYSIDTKQDKRAHYQPCDTYWLLLWIDYMDPAMDQHIHNVDYSPIHKRGFEKVIIYRTTYNDYIEL